MSRFWDWDYPEEAAKACAGNWRKFESFSWHDRPDDADSWCIVYTRNRDSGLLDQSNEAAINAILTPFCDGDDPDAVSERHSHWACGWVDGYSIRVYRDGAVTAAFRAWCEIKARLSNYPVLDEEDYSRREYEATHENIREAGRRWVREDAPEDWPHLVWEWLWENNQREVENRDDQGAYPSDAALTEAMSELGLLEDEEVPAE